jgi:hypothetical protein
MPANEDILPTTWQRWAYSTPLFLLFVLATLLFGVLEKLERLHAELGLTNPSSLAIFNFRTFLANFPWLLPAIYFLAAWTYFAWACRNKRRMRICGIGLLLVGLIGFVVAGWFLASPIIEVFGKL